MVHHNIYKILYIWCMKIEEKWTCIFTYSYSINFYDIDWKNHRLLNKHYLEKHTLIFYHQGVLYMLHSPQWMPLTTDIALLTWLKVCTDFTDMQNTTSRDPILDAK